MDIRFILQEINYAARFVGKQKMLNSINYETLRQVQLTLKLKMFYFDDTENNSTKSSVGVYNLFI